MPKPIKPAAVCCLALALLLGCAKAEYRFEKIDGAEPVALPLKLESFSGLRDGATVRATARFADGSDHATMNIVIFLRPPAEFQSGTHESVIGGTNHSGTVESPSLSFQGGQTALPSVGGVFILKDEQNRPLYRVQIPAATLTRQ